MKVKRTIRFPGRVFQLSAALGFVLGIAFILTMFAPCTRAQTQAAASSAAPATQHSATAKKKSSKKHHSSRREPSQKAPTADRISEIQSALSRNGFYDGNANGKWDSSSVAAMQKFQSANGLDPTGKLDARSLQKLGLGSEIAGVYAPETPHTTPAATQKPATSGPAATPAPAAQPQKTDSAAPGSPNPHKLFR